MKIKVGIVGYGNLGKECEKLLIHSNEFKLVSIFSRRKNISSPYKNKIEDINNANRYINKIDVMLMCGGSKDDLAVQSPLFLKNFNIIDTFDTHKKITSHKTNLKRVSFLSNKSAIYSCGWDPGLLSIIRKYASALLQNPNIYTLWGKGVSQGHSDALRRIDGVKDAIQYTVPKTGIAKQILKGEKIDEAKLHRRICYVCIKDGANSKEIVKTILSTPFYFKGQDVEINFQNQVAIYKKKQHLFHKGKVLAISQNKDAKMIFNVEMKSNPTFTANIMLAYAKIIRSLPIGVYSPLDIPPSKLISTTETYI